MARPNWPASPTATGTLQHPHRRGRSRRRGEDRRARAGSRPSRWKPMNGGGLSPRGARHTSPQSTHEGVPRGEPVRAVGGRSPRRRLGTWPQSSRRPSAAGEPLVRPLTPEHKSSATSCASCASSGRRSPAATSCKRSPAMSIPPSATTRLGARAGRADQPMRCWPIARVVRLQPPDASKPPRALVRRDGGSVWDAPRGGPVYDPRDARHRGPDLARRADRPRRGRRARHRLRPSTAPSRRAHSARRRPARRTTAITSQGRRLEVVIGPAGTGKTTMLRVATRLGQCRLPGDRPRPHRGSRRCICAAKRTCPRRPSPSSSTGTTTSDRPLAGCSPPATSLSSTKPACSPTRDLDRLVDLVSRHGAKLVLVGDHHQLGAIRAPGGMFAALADTLGASRAPRSASLHRPLGSPRPRRAPSRCTVPASRRSARHGRVHGGPQPQAHRDCLHRLVGRPPRRL